MQRPSNMRPASSTARHAAVSSLVEKAWLFGSPAALKERDGWPDPELHMTAVVDDLEISAPARLRKSRTGSIFTRTPYFFGCEADDKMNAAAFNPEHSVPCAAERVPTSSNIGHST